MKYQQFIIIFALLLNSLLFADDPINKFVPPEPLVGTDSLENIFSYPITLKKFYYEGAFKIKLDIDNEGIIESLIYEPLFKSQFSNMDSIIIKITKSKLQSIKWKPAKYNGKDVSSFVDIPVIFLLKNNSSGVNRYYRDKWSYDMNKNYIHSPILIENQKPTIVRCK